MGRVAVIFYFVMLLSVLKFDLTQPTVQEKVCYSATWKAAVIAHVGGGLFANVQIEVL